MTSEEANTPAPSTSLTLVAASFVVFGMFWGSWTVAAADVERTLSLSHSGFGLLLSVALVGAALMNGIGGAWTERRGTSHALASALAVWGCLVVVAAVVPTRVAFALVLLGLITSGGLVDVVMNVAATAALVDRPGALVRFHAWFNSAAALGAAASGILLGSKLSYRWTWVAVGGAALVLAMLSRRARLPAGEAGEHIPLGGFLRTLHREHLVLVAAAFAVGAIVEGGVELWGVLFLRTHVSRGLVIGASSAVLAYVVAATARVVFGPSVGRRGASRGAALGATTAGIGVVILVVAPYAWMSGAGLVVAAGGASMCWPLLIAHASSGRSRPGAIVGALSSFGYLGFIVGPAIIGGIAGAAGLRIALLVLAVGAVFVAAAASASKRRPV